MLGSFRSICVILFLAFFISPSARAETAVEAPSYSAGDTAWMLVSSALVLFMTLPGLALFYGGLVRTKNVLSVIMQCMAMATLISLQWFFIGYSLAFHEGGFWGGFGWRFLAGIETSPVAAEYASKVPPQLFMIFQLMFAIITPALICGSFAERVKFPGVALFLLLWSTFVYDPLAHWVWGKGGWLRIGGDNAWGALDFAGGAVVHISSGISALVCAWFLGARRGHKEEPMPPHSAVLTLVGAAMLWVGWFGFNAGSALEASPLAVLAFCNTHFAAAAAAFSWALVEWVHRGRISAIGTATGAVAGLVAITPACGFVTVDKAVLIGLIGGSTCFVACAILKEQFKYDDTLDAFGVHGVGGVVGALLTGVFAVTSVNEGGANGLLAGNARQFLNQLVATGITIVYSGSVTVLLLFAVNAVVGIRVHEEEELQGLDLTQHGEVAYNV